MDGLERLLRRVQALEASKLLSPEAAARCAEAATNSALTLALARIDGDVAQETRPAPPQKSAPPAAADARGSRSASSQHTQGGAAGQQASGRPNAAPEAASSPKSAAAAKPAAAPPKANAFTDPSLSRTPPAKKTFQMGVLSVLSVRRQSKGLQARSQVDVAATAAKSAKAQAAEKAEGARLAFSDPMLKSSLRP